MCSVFTNGVMAISGVHLCTVVCGVDKETQGKPEVLSYAIKFSSILGGDGETTITFLLTQTWT